MWSNAATTFFALALLLHEVRSEHASVKEIFNKKWLVETNSKIITDLQIDKSRTLIAYMGCENPEEAYKLDCRITSRILDLNGTETSRSCGITLRADKSYRINKLKSGVKVMRNGNVVLYHGDSMMFRRRGDSEFLYKIKVLDMDNCKPVNSKEIVLKAFDTFFNLDVDGETFDVIIKTDLPGCNSDEERCMFTYNFDGKLVHKPRKMHLNNLSYYLTRYVGNSYFVTNYFEDKFVTSFVNSEGRLVKNFTINPNNDKNLYEFYQAKNHMIQVCTHPKNSKTHNCFILDHNLRLKYKATISMKNSEDSVDYAYLRVTENNSKSRKVNVLVETGNPNSSIERGNAIVKFYFFEINDLLCFSFYSNDGLKHDFFEVKGKHVYYNLKCIDKKVVKRSYIYF